MAPDPPLNDRRSAASSAAAFTQFRGPAARPGRVPVLPPHRTIAAVAAGGMIGAVLRVGLAQGFPPDPGGVPWITFIENIVGAFLLGLILVAVLERWRPRRQVQPFLCTGILGSFTTFSNYTVEIVTLGPQHLYLAVLYAFLSIAAGLVAAILGMTIARRWPPSTTPLAPFNALPQHGNEP